MITKDELVESLFSKVEENFGYKYAMANKQVITNIINDLWSQAYRPEYLSQEDVDHAYYNHFKDC